MGMPLYYEAERGQPLTEQEESMCREIHTEIICFQIEFDMV